MPALTYEQVTPSRPVFHVLETPGNVGRIPEVFRYLPGTLRSLHPTHSICAAGVRAEEFVRDHILDSTPCGPHSPLSLLPKVGGQVLMLGCGLEPNTSMHAIEELVEPEYLFDPPLAYRLVLADGRFVEKTYRPHAFHGWSQRYDRLADVMSGGLRAGTVLQASSYLIEADEMWRSVEKQIRVDPLYFVQKAS
jgi:aminoglycoside 3-N-acetyltransferase